MSVLDKSGSCDKLKLPEAPKELSKIQQLKELLRIEARINDFKQGLADFPKHFEPDQVPRLPELEQIGITNDRLLKEVAELLEPYDSIEICVEKSKEIKDRLECLNNTYQKMFREFCELFQSHVNISKDNLMKDDVLNKSLETNKVKY